MTAKVELTIRDHGAGIPDYAREKVFERFYSLRHHSARPQGHRPRPHPGARGRRTPRRLHHLDPADGGGTVARLVLPLA